jgi:TDG/mug DNA glycosylase family protein
MAAARSKRSPARRRRDLEAPAAPYKPTKAELAAATDKTVRDIIAPDLLVLFCGINPGLYSGAVGHHFARPGNRFWPALHAAGFTDELLSPFQERRLLERGYGVTNVVMRTTAAASDLEHHEIVAGGKKLRAEVRRYRPRVLAVLGITTYRAAFDRPGAEIGEQPETIGGTRVWALPNPSGLNAHYQVDDLARLFRKLRRAAVRSG